MPSPALVLGGLRVASGLIGGQSGRSAAKKAAKEAKRVGKLRAGELERQAELEDELRIEQKQAEMDIQARRRSQIEGIYSKSGVLMTGTPAHAFQEQREADIYALEQGDEAAQERARRLRMAAKMELEGAESAAKAYETAGGTDFLQGLFQAGTGALSAWMDFGSPSKTDTPYGITPRKQPFSGSTTKPVFSGFGKTLYDPAATNPFSTSAIVKRVTDFTLKG